MTRSPSGGDRVSTSVDGDRVEMRCSACGRTARHPAQPAAALLDALQGFIEVHADCEADT